MTTARLRLGAWGASVGTVAALLAGCGGSGEASSDFCKSVDALAAAVKQINQTSLTKSSVEAVQKSLVTMQTAVSNVADSAETEFSSEVDAVQGAAADLGDTVTAAADQPNPDTVYAARMAMSALVTAVTDLDKATSESC